MTRRRGESADRVGIRNLPFRHNVKSGLGFEIFRLANLYDRADLRMLGHELETPQRPEFHTIYVGIRGSGRLVVDFTPVPLGAEYLTFVARGRVQQFVPDRSVDAWMLLIAPEFLAVERDSTDPIGSAASLAPTWANPAAKVPPADHRVLLSIVEQIDAEHARALDRIQPWLLSALLRALLLHAERLIAGSVAPLAAPVTRFLTILERDHATTRSVSHYARASGVSARRLRELVVSHTGKTTKQLIDERVVLEQKRLLVHSSLSVKQLAEQTGFEEPTNLVKFFRHHTGQTPLAFRAAFAAGQKIPSSRRS